MAPYRAYCSAPWVVRPDESCCIAGVSEAAVQELTARADVRLVFCHTAREFSIRRFIDRFERGERHWCFDDAARVEQLRLGKPDLAWERAQPLDSDLPSLVVDTT